MGTGIADAALAIAVALATHRASPPPRPRRRHRNRKHCPGHGMRELTGQMLALAEEIGEGGLLRAHGGFSPATVALHLISAENSAGDPGAAIATATSLAPAMLPTT